MEIANKLVTVAENVSKVYEAGYNKAESVNPLPYISVKDFQWNNVAFPEGFDFVLSLKNKPNTMNALLSGATGLKTVTLICDAEGTTNYAQLVRQTPIDTLDLRNFKPTPSDLSYFAYQAKNLVSILGALDLSNCTKATSAFAITNSILEDIEFKPLTIPISLDFSLCKNLTHDSLMSILYGLMDYGVKFYEYDISDNPLSCMTSYQITNGLDTYTITTALTGDEGEIYATSKTTGETVGFYCHSSMGLSEEVLNSLRTVGTQLIIDCTVEDVTYDVTYNSFKILYHEGGGTVQTLIIGTTNLVKLTDEEKAIATEKGWTLA